MISDFLDGGLEPVDKVLTLADGAVGYSTAGDHLSPDTIATLDHLKADIVSGTRVVPQAPSGNLSPPASATVSQTGTVTFDGSTCRYDGPTEFSPGEVIRVVFVNATDRDAEFLSWPPIGWNAIEVPAPPGGQKRGIRPVPCGDIPVGLRGRGTSRWRAPCSQPRVSSRDDERRRRGA